MDAPASAEPATAKGRARAPDTSGTTRPALHDDEGGGCNERDDEHYNKNLHVDTLPGQTREEPMQDRIALSVKVAPGRASIRSRDTRRPRHADCAAVTQQPRTKAPTRSAGDESRAPARKHSHSRERRRDVLDEDRIRSAIIEIELTARIGRQDVR